MEVKLFDPTPFEQFLNYFDTPSQMWPAYTILCESVIRTEAVITRSYLSMNAHAFHTGFTPEESNFLEPIFRGFNFLTPSALQRSKTF